jgi:DNA helicase-2/ATP-dependent DNA helicase PcrA
LRLIHNPSDSISLSRIINVPVRGIGQRTLAELSAWAKNQSLLLYSALKLISEKKGPPLQPRASYALTGFVNLVDELISKSAELNLTALLDEILEKSGYKTYVLSEEDGEDRWENIMELYTVAKEYNGLEPGEALTAFLEKVALVSDVDDLEEQPDVVTLITLHQAKGLEFPVVFIVGMEEGLLPHRRSMDDHEELEEERRLCYVGITRAKQRVYLLHAYRRSLFGNSGASERSRFLGEIAPHLVTTNSLLEEQKDDDFTPVTALFAKSKPPQKPLVVLELKAGDQVNHKIFGQGVVVSCSPNRGDHEVTVNFDGVGTKRLLLSLAPLEKIA